MHNTSKVLLGANQSNFATIENRKGVIPAGKIVRLKSDDTISIAAADGNPLGISMGRSLSGTSRTAVARRGTRVPVLLTAAFNPTIGAQVHISDTTGIAIASGAGASGMNAVYATGRIGGSGANGGQDEDGNAVGVALIDFPGGL